MYSQMFQLISLVTLLPTHGHPWITGNSIKIADRNLANQKYGSKFDFLKKGIAKRSAGNGLQRSDICSYLYPNYPYICADNSWCIAESQICDDVVTCYDSSDEEDCAVDTRASTTVSQPFLDTRAGGCAVSFPRYPYRCSRKSSMCISDKQLCDALGQCEEFNDEVGCEYGYGEMSNCRVPITDGMVGCKGNVDLSFQMLDAHNYMRCMHGVGPLGWDQHLADVALETARQNANIGRMMHSRRGYGENLAMIEIADVYHASGFGIVKMWYDEIELYNFNMHGFSHRTGHLTQLLWADTTRIGCAVDYNYGALFVACEYNPPGNVFGQYEDNVFPPLYNRT